MPDMILRAALLMLCQFMAVTSAFAGTSTVDELMALDRSPAGVVFEIADRDPQALEFALPWVNQAARKLKSRFPDLQMAIVSHGQEMFTLRNELSDRHSGTHALVKSLSREQGIPLHVCETHAGWKGVSPEAFPDYVNVAPSGPVQIKNYEALDYVRVLVPRALKIRKN